MIVTLEATMKTKIYATAFLLLVLAWLCADDGMYGAFRIKTDPKGADVTLYDPDTYLCDTPSPVYPVVMDEYMELREGIPGRAIMLMITKKGYVPLKKEIFVPFTYENMQEALDDPSEFSFELERDHKNIHWRICLFYSYRHRHPRPHFGFGRPNWQPWTPPGHHGGHGHAHNGGHGHGHNGGQGHGNNGQDPPTPPPPPPHPGGGTFPGGYGSGPNEPSDSGYGLTTALHPSVGASPEKPNPPAIKVKAKPNPPNPDAGLSTAPVPNVGASTQKPDPQAIKIIEKPKPPKPAPKTEKQDKPVNTPYPKSDKPEYKDTNPSKEEVSNKIVKLPQADKKENDSKKDEELKKSKK